MKSEPGPPMMLGGAAAAQLRLIVWCKDCRHQIVPDPAEMAARHGARNARARLARQLVGSRCGSQFAVARHWRRFRSRPYSLLSLL
jgi:uncharacterized protein with PIN domain